MECTNGDECKYNLLLMRKLIGRLLFVVGAQYRSGTELWATEWKGMLAPPDFGRVLSHDRFVRILRYLARGPDGTEHTKESDPWAEIRWMVDGFNTTRKNQFRAGWIVTPTSR